jgi:hypothetical protein
VHLLRPSEPREVRTLPPDLERMATDPWFNTRETSIEGQ